MSNMTFFKAFQFQFLFSLLVLVSLAFPSVAVDVCPPDDIVYTPFTPVQQPRYTSCWHWADCVLASAEEVRKQQFNATSLVMGLIPLVLNDIAWPKRRLIYVSRRLSRLIEVVARALGIVPVPITGPNSLGNNRGLATTRIYEWTRSQSFKRRMLLAGASVVALGFVFAALALVEIHSKRSSLGCTYSMFVLTWHIIAIIPAASEVFLSRHKTEQNASANMAQNSTSQTRQTARPSASTQVTLHQDHAFAIQGGDDPWLNQLVWGIYFTAGTLVYTSIMAVTVIELFVWVCASVGAATLMRLLAFYLCMCYEDTVEHKVEEEA